MPLLTLSKILTARYSGEDEVGEVTLGNVGEHLLYYNGETYDEYLSNYADENTDINDIINS